jgi:hypothetical protein
MNFEDRVRRLEAMIPQDTDYGEIYDFLFEAEQTIGCPPGVLPEEQALRRLGPRELFVQEIDK